MIYEVAQLSVHKERAETFMQAFSEVAPLLVRAQGYRGHVLGQEIENPNLFHLLVEWRSLEDHTPNFEATEDHRKFMMGLQDYLSEEPTVVHIAGVAFAAVEQICRGNASLRGNAGPVV